MCGEQLESHPCHLGLAPGGGRGAAVLRAGGQSGAPPSALHTRGPDVGPWPLGAVLTAEAPGQTLRRPQWRRARRRPGGLCKAEGGGIKDLHGALSHMALFLGFFSSFSSRGWDEKEGGNRLLQEASLAQLGRPTLLFTQAPLELTGTHLQPPTPREEGPEPFVLGGPSDRSQVLPGPLPWACCLSPLSMISPPNPPSCCFGGVW